MHTVGPWLGSHSFVVIAGPAMLVLAMAGNEGLASP